MTKNQKIALSILLILTISVSPAFAQRLVIVFGLDETGSYDLREKGIEIAARLIAGLKPGDVLYLRSITAESYHDSCSILRIEIPELIQAPKNRFDIRAYSKYQRVIRQINIIKKQAIDLLKKLPPIKAGHTDIHGFFVAAADRLKAESARGKCDKKIIVATDMQDNTNIQTNTDLSKAKVIVAGFQSGSDPNQNNEIKEQWTNILVHKYNAGSVYYLPADCNFLNL